MESDKAKGLIFGLAIGDALGYPTEFMTLSRIKTDFGPAGITDFTKSPALFTDDTQMSIAVAEALIKAGDQQGNSTSAPFQPPFQRFSH